MFLMENILYSNLLWIAAWIGHGAEPDLLAVRRLLQHHRPREPGHHESRLVYQGERTFQLPTPMFRIQIRKFRTDLAPGPAMNKQKKLRKTLNLDLSVL
jgi:hypothetical protein